MKDSSRSPSHPVSRRDFIARTAQASSATALVGAGALSAFAAETFAPPIVVFSKVYQTLKLNFDEAAAITAEAGLDGIDCPARPGGAVLPERATEDLPRYSEALRKSHVQLPLLTTAITSPASEHTEDILRTARKLGVQFYRAGFIERQKDFALDKQLREARLGFKELVALNKQIGIGALVQNHSPSGHEYIGGDLTQLYEIVKDFDPEQLGVAFDIGHALIVHGDDWRSHFEKLKPHIKIAYIKDVKCPRGWVPFGQGDIAQTGYFKLLRQMRYRAPISLHIEFDWTEAGKSKTRGALLAALQQSRQVLKRWLAEA